MNPSDFKNPNQSKEERIKNWRDTLMQWKDKRQGKPAMPQASAINEVEMRKLKEKIAQLEGNLKAESDKSSGLESRRKLIEADLDNLKKEKGRIEAIAAKESEELLHTRQSYSAKLVGIQKQMQGEHAAQAKKVGELEEYASKLKKQISEKEASIKEAEERYSEAVVKVQALLDQLNAKSKEMEQMNRTLGRYHSGEVEKGLVTRIHELEKAQAELKSQITSKDMELSDFKQFLAERERDFNKELEREGKDHGKTVESLEDNLRSRQKAVEQLEGELSSFRNLLRKEEERSRIKDSNMHALEENKQQLVEKLSDLGADIKDYQSKLSRHFDRGKQEPETKGRTPDIGFSAPSSSLGQMAAEFDVEGIISESDPSSMLDADIESIKEDLDESSGV